VLFASAIATAHGPHPNPKSPCKDSIRRRRKVVAWGDDFLASLNCSLNFCPISLALSLDRRRPALAAGLTGLQLRYQRRQVGIHRAHLAAADHVRTRLAAAAVGHILRPDAGHALQQFPEWVVSLSRLFKFLPRPTSSHRFRHVLPRCMSLDLARSFRRHHASSTEALRGSADVSADQA
jgi:hypothetical protein